MLTITTGDSGAIEGTIDADLTGATAVQVHLKHSLGGVLSKPATVGDPTKGEWSIPYAKGDITAAGICYVEIEVTFSSTDVQTFALDDDDHEMQFLVREEYA